MSSIGPLWFQQSSSSWHLSSWTTQLCWLKSLGVLLQCIWNALNQKSWNEEYKPCLYLNNLLFGKLNCSYYCYFFCFNYCWIIVLLLWACKLLKNCLCHIFCSTIHHFWYKQFKIKSLKSNWKTMAAWKSKVLKLIHVI